MKLLPFFITKNTNNNTLTATLFFTALAITVCNNESYAAQGAVNSTEIATKALTELKTSQTIPGLAAALVYNGQLQPFITLGEEDVKTKKPVTDDTIFALGSVTKSFTGTLAAIAINEKKLTLGDTVAKWLPQFANKPIGKVTIKDLATHTSALPMYPPHFHSGTYTTVDFMTYLQTWTSSDKPGTKYSYSNPGYWLLRYIVEKTFNSTYEDLLSKYVFNPLEMTSSSVQVPVTLQAKKAQGYASNNAVATPLPTVTPANEAIAGEVQSTAADMGQFLKANLGLNTVPEPLRNAITLSHENQFAMSPTSHTTIGWFTTTKDGVTVVDKDGETEGFSSYIGIVPDKKLGIAIMVNKHPIDATTTGRQILRQLAQ